MVFATSLLGARAFVNNRTGSSILRGLCLLFFDPSSSAFVARCTTRLFTDKPHRALNNASPNHF